MYGHVIAEFSRMDRISKGRTIRKLMGRGGGGAGGGRAKYKKNSRKGKLNDSGTVSSFLQRNKFRYQVQNHKAMLYESSRDYATEIRA